MGKSTNAGKCFQLVNIMPMLLTPCIHYLIVSLRAIKMEFLFSLDLLFSRHSLQSSTSTYPQGLKRKRAYESKYDDESVYQNSRIKRRRFTVSEISDKSYPCRYRLPTKLDHRGKDLPLRKKPLNLVQAKKSVRRRSQSSLPAYYAAWEAASLTKTSFITRKSTASLGQHSLMKSQSNSSYPNSFFPLMLRYLSK